jgi:hypothetical protein
MGESAMRNFRIRLFGAALTVLLICGLASSSNAESGTVSVVFTKAALVVGAGGGHGVLHFRGHRYPFRVSGMSVGYTFGVSTTRLSGRALNLNSPSDIQGTYGVIGAGGALAAGAGGVLLQNEKGVTLQLAGGKIGIEISAAVGAVTVALR